ncbi:MAG: glucosamine-6-phosphate deaminase [Verrucomicrobiota bacterium]
MEIIIQPDAKAGCEYASKLISNLIKQKPNAVLGLATGGTPVPVYQSLIQKHKNEGLDFSKVKSFNLDEYIGIQPTHSASYQYYMKTNLFDHVNIRPENAKVPNGMASDIEAHCQDYEAQIKAAGGLDLQLLGIGGEGHIGFNEPSSSLASRTRVKTLITRTREDNKRFFLPGEEVPHHVITMGIGTIMEARTIVLLAFGASKAEAIAHSLEGPITSRIPASILQMHPKTIVLLDEAAASKLEMADYYRHVYANKCDWQRVK